MPPGMMGSANPANIEAMRAAGSAGAMAPPPQMPASAPPGAMAQSEFGRGGPIPPDVQARRAAQLIKMLRARGG
jgi:hypothetical protein